MDESSSAPPPPRAQPAAPAAAEADGWGSFADEAPAADAAASPPPPPPGPPQGFVRGHGVPVPSPEVAASLLSAGETLWAQVDGAQAVLGSGCRVGVVPDEDGNAVADGFSGWRPVTVVDPAALTVRLVPLALSEPPVGVATPVAELYADPEPYTAPAPGRAGPFPTGQGPDLDELLNRVLSEERARARADAEAEARRAEQELARLKGELKDQAQAAESRAEQREQRAQEAARRAQEYAEQQIAAARDDAARIVWQLQDRAQRAEAEIARLTGELARAEQAGVLRHVLDRRRRAGGGRDQGA